MHKCIRHVLNVMRQRMQVFFIRTGDAMILWTIIVKHAEI